MLYKTYESQNYLIQGLFLERRWVLKWQHKQMANIFTFRKGCKRVPREISKLTAWAACPLELKHSGNNTLHVHHISLQKYHTSFQKIYWKTIYHFKITRDSYNKWLLHDFQLLYSKAPRDTHTLDFKPGHHFPSWDSLQIIAGAGTLELQAVWRQMCWHLDN